VPKAGRDGYHIGETEYLHWFMVDVEGAFIE
jgi:hypothetical protein